MRRSRGLGLCMLFAACFVHGQRTDVVYVDGFVDLKLSSGERMEAFIGDYLERGDTIITERNGLAELEQENGTIIKIAEDTIFTLQEIEQNGEKRSVLSTTLGAVAFKFAMMARKEPLIATPGMVAGIRGTEFQIFAGLDGSTLVVVASGKVEVEAQGRSVELLPDEGVEVPAGSAPGEKFEVLRGQLDFSAWNSGRLESMLEDPAGAIRGVEKGIEAFRVKIAELVPMFEENYERLRAERDKLPQIEKEEGKEARTKYYEEVVAPLELETTYLRLNLRYYALSALSFRRYVLGPMYARVTSSYINRLESAEYQGFRGVYARILSDYTRDVTPFLVDADF